jgi:hypothetical protein
MGKKHLRILGDGKLARTIKIIEIPRKEAFEFIDK